MEITYSIFFFILCRGILRSSSEVLLRQKRNWIIDSFTINESYSGKFPYSLGKIKMEKDLILFKIQGQGVDKPPLNVLEINEHTGEITVLRSVNHEEFPNLKLTFLAIDKEKNVIDTKLGIDIKIVDSNDNPPRFDLENYKITIEESALQGTAVVTIKAQDNDRSETYNTFDYKIVSVTPSAKNLEFYLTQTSTTGTISFKGCLDHETAEKYTIIVEAKDYGDIRLSSSCTVTVTIKDGNNHLPVITEQIGPGKVKEGQENILVSRIKVKDEDTKGTPAWRAVYTIQGDTKNNFRIITDPETNEGLLYVEKHLSYEDGATKNITITAKNEIPYYSCEVEEITATGLWKVVTKSDSISTEAVVHSLFEKQLSASTTQITLVVEDVNEPPVFENPIKIAVVGENIVAGQYLETFTATDPDVTSANTFKYIKGHDPADWVKVNPKTGEVITTKTLDRESEFVKDGIYVVTIYAVDDGTPSMTSTATLSINVKDENDNAPFLVESSIDICQSDEPSLGNITVDDSDDEPYNGPFTYKLHGDVEGKWKVVPGQDNSAKLMKENTVHSGHYELLLEVSDLQGKAANHSLSVTVCSCLDTKRPNCDLRKTAGATLGAGAVVILLLGMLLIAGLLPLTFLISCKEELKEIEDDHCGQQQLMISNTEYPGTDCSVVAGDQNGNQMQLISQVKTVTSNPMQSMTVSQGHVEEYGMSQNEFQHKTRSSNKNLQWLINYSPFNGSQTNSEISEHQIKMSEARPFTRGNFNQMSLGASSAMGMRHLRGKSMHGTTNEAVSGGSQASSVFSDYQRQSSMARGNFVRMSLGASAMGMRHLRAKSMHGVINEAVSGGSQVNSTTEYQRGGTMAHGTFENRSLGASSVMGMRQLQRNSMREIWMDYSKLEIQLNKNLNTIKKPDKELGDYEPHVYAEEGDAEHNFELDAISIADVSFDPEMDLGVKFSSLASVCMPNDITTTQTMT